MIRTRIFIVFCYVFLASIVPYSTILASSPVLTTATLENKSVPFYSQFKNISSPKWQKVGCGITSLAMVIDFYGEKNVSVDTLLSEGVVAGAYLDSAGWTYEGLISVSKKHGLDGESYDLGTLNTNTAFTQFKNSLAAGPVIASVHYKFDPKNPIPHLVVINKIDGNFIYYNDPASTIGDEKISINTFLKAWKKRFIVVRPT